ncbi:hypothetical protein D3C73_1190420 [compost metagenome]
MIHLVLNIYKIQFALEEISQVLGSGLGHRSDFRVQLQFGHMVNEIEAVQKKMWLDLELQVIHLHPLLLQFFLINCDLQGSDSFSQSCETGISKLKFSDFAALQSKVSFFPFIIFKLSSEVTNGVQHIPSQINGHDPQSE